MEKDKLIVPVAEEERRKIYKLNEAGRELLKLEIKRLREMVRNGNNEMGDQA